MSFRLTPSAQRKKKLVTSVKGETYCRSVMGADFVMLLGQSAIEVDIPAINK